MPATVAENGSQLVQNRQPGALPLGPWARAFTRAPRARMTRCLCQQRASPPFDGRIGRAIARRRHGLGRRERAPICGRHHLHGVARRVAPHFLRFSLVEGVVQFAHAAVQHLNRWVANTTSLRRGQDGVLHLRQLSEAPLAPGCARWLLVTDGIHRVGRIQADGPFECTRGGGAERPALCSTTHLHQSCIEEDDASTSVEDQRASPLQRATQLSRVVAPAGHRGWLRALAVTQSRALCWHAGGPRGPPRVQCRCGGCLLAAAGTSSICWVVVVAPQRTARAVAFEAAAAAAAHPRDTSLLLCRSVARSAISRPSAVGCPLI